MASSGFPVAVNSFSVRNLVRTWLSQEIPFCHPKFDTALSSVKLVIYSCSSGILAGTPFVDCIFKNFDCSVEWHTTEGDFCGVKSKIVSVVGNPYDLMLCESLVLSVLSRASGVASQTKQLRKVLSDVSWKGKFCVSSTRTPGFGLVEEYAMLVGGAEPYVHSVLLRQPQVRLAGGMEKAVKEARLRYSDAKLEVECLTSSDGVEASAAGADIVAFSNVKIMDLSLIVPQLKRQYPKVQIHVVAALDEDNLRAVAQLAVDSIATSKLTNGYDFTEFQAVYESCNSLEIAPRVSAAPPEANSRSSSPEIAGESTGIPTSSPAVKKSRLNDDHQESANPVPTSNKPNGVQNRRPQSNVTSSSSNTSRGSNAKRAQRNKMSQHNAQRRQSSMLSRSPGSASSNRFLTPGASSSRSSNSGNATQSGGVMGPPNSSHLGLRMPNSQQQLNQQLTSRFSGQLAPGMLGNGPNVVAGFLGLPTGDSQQGGSGMHSNRPPVSPSGPIMGGIGGGFGMRFWGPGGGGGFMNCRGCGVTNGPGLLFCRNCRAPLR